jgi:hypothetical protein
MASPKEFECTNVFGNRVGCSKKRWKHIYDHHPELESLQELVKSIIIKPDFVCRSRAYANRRTFYRKCLLSQLGRDERYIRVVIEYQRIDEEKFYGNVITAMVCDGTQLGEVVIWER